VTVTKLSVLTYENNVHFRLMDLFYDTVEAEEGKKSRVHYHDFMQVVHNLLHEAKKAAPPRDVSR